MGVGHDFFDELKVGGHDFFDELKERSYPFFVHSFSEAVFLCLTMFFLDNLV